MGPAGVARLRSFREKVFQDTTLQAKLLGIDDREQFLQAVVAMAAEHGCNFDLEVAESAFNQKRSEWVERLVSG